MTDAQFNKLPTYVQAEIRRLRHRLAVLVEEKVVADAAKEPTRIMWGYGTHVAAPWGYIRDTFPLRFFLGEKPDAMEDSVWAGLEFDAPGQERHLLIRGWGAISVDPSADNTIVVRVRR